MTLKDPWSPSETPITLGEGALIYGGASSKNLRVQPWLDWVTQLNAIPKVTTEQGIGLYGLRILGLRARME